MAFFIDETTRYRFNPETEDFENEGTIQGGFNKVTYLEEAKPIAHAYLRLNCYAG